MAAQPLPVVHSQDGAADDQMALLLLLLNHDVLATILTPADSRLEPAVEMTKKTLAAFGPGTHLIVNDVETQNSFPDEWRDEAFEVNRRYECGADTGQIVERDIEHLVQLLRESVDPVIFVETGPATALAQILDMEPALSTKIRRIVWTAGSFGGTGSSPPPGCDGSQTWNSYCDPVAADEILRSGIDVVLCTREVTERAALTRAFYDGLPDTPAGRIFRQVYSFYVDKPFYRLWDVLTASYIDIWTAFCCEVSKVRVITAGSSQGKIEVSPDGDCILVAKDIEIERFYRYVTESLARA